MPKVLDDFVRQSIDELLKTLPAEELRKRLSAEERLEGLPPEELRKRLSPEERLKGLPPEDRFKGLTPDEIAKALPPDVLDALARLKASDPGSEDQGKTGQP